jgi:hypothetical protein
MKFAIVIGYIFHWFNTILQIPPCPGGPPCNPEDPGIPITGGIALLLSAAIGLGLRFFQKKKV